MQAFYTVTLPFSNIVVCPFPSMYKLSPPLTNVLLVLWGGGGGGGGGGGSGTIEVFLVLGAVGLAAKVTS